MSSRIKGRVCRLLGIYCCCMDSNVSRFCDWIFVFSKHYERKWCL